MICLHPYNIKSKSAILLAEELGVPIVGVDINVLSTKLKVINWGYGDEDLDSFFDRRIHLNHPKAIRNAINKIKTFEKLYDSNVPTVPWTTSMTQALTWLASGSRVCAREKVSGKDGDGLSILNSLNDFKKAKLYTRFIKSKEEYRVNVFKDTAVSVQRKVRVPGKSHYNDYVKTTSGGYGFQLCDYGEVPMGVRPAAKRAVAALGLDFGGVDILLGEDDLPYVLEVNTAPELTPTTAKKFANAIKNHFS